MSSGVSRLSLKHKCMLVALALVPALFFAWMQWQSNRVAERLKTEDIELTTFKRNGVKDPKASPIKLYATHGDIFEPYARGEHRAYDAIVVSAMLDPVYQVDDMLVWEANLLVRSALSYAVSDKKMTNSLLRGLILEMSSRNKEFVTQLIKTPVSKLNEQEDYLATLCEPYVQPTEPGSRLRRSGVRWIVVVPLFKSGNGRSFKERKKYLETNVRIASGRVMNLSGLWEKDLRIRSIAFPALAGTEHLMDSWNYITYASSFSEIYKGISGRKIPSMVERIYFVVWDKLEQLAPQESRASLAGVASMQGDLFIREKGLKRLANALLLIFAVAYLLCWLVKAETVSEAMLFLKKNRRGITLFFVTGGLAAFWAYNGGFAKTLENIYTIGGQALLLLSLIGGGALSVCTAYLLSPLNQNEAAGVAEYNR